MDVENAIGEGGDELRREQPHVAGQADQIDMVLAQAGEHIGVVLGAGAALGDKDGVVAGRVRGRRRGRGRRRRWR